MKPISLIDLRKLAQWKGVAIANIALPGAPDFAVEVRVLEIKSRFGRNDVLVTPVAGSGQAYVSQRKLTKRDRLAA